jgi:hypothetical protein
MWTGQGEFACRRDSRNRYWGESVGSNAEMDIGQNANRLTSLDAVVFGDLTTPPLQILAAAGPLSRWRHDREEFLASTGEFLLWPALLSLAATRMDVEALKKQGYVGLVEAVREYQREYNAIERGGPRLGQPIDMAMLQLRAVDRCLVGFVKSTVPMFHDEDPDWILRQALRIARDAERTLVERGLVVNTICPDRSLPMAALLALVPKRFLARTPAGDALLTAFKQACNVPPDCERRDLAVNHVLLRWIPEVAFLFVDLLRHG